MYDLRQQTRDRLACACNPPISNYCGVQVVPSVVDFARMMYKVAQEGGYEGTEQDFIMEFAAVLSGEISGGQIFYANSKDNFPEQGEINALYVDTGAQSLYFWDEDSQTYALVFSSGEIDVSNKMDKVPTAAENNVAIFNDSGNVKDSGHSLEEYATVDQAIQGVLIGSLEASIIDHKATFDKEALLAELAIQPSGISNIYVGDKPDPLTIINGNVTLPLAAQDQPGVVKIDFNENEFELDSNGNLVLKELDAMKIVIKDNDQLILECGNATV